MADFNKGCGKLEIDRQTKITALTARSYAHPMNQLKKRGILIVVLLEKHKLTFMS